MSAPAPSLSSSTITPPVIASGESVSVGSVFSPHMLVFERTHGPRLPMWAVWDVAAAMRGSLLAHACRPVPTLVSGHEPRGGPAQRDHLAIVPLPEIGRPGASGVLVGVALVFPRRGSSDALAAVHDALTAWDRAGATLRMGRWGRWRLSACPQGAGYPALRPPTWCRASTQWASATPVVLDRFPGMLEERRSDRGPDRHPDRGTERHPDRGTERHSQHRPDHDPERRLERCARARARARDSITAACRRIGLPDPIEIELHDPPVLAGSVAARRVPGNPAHGPRRVRVHVRLRFEHPVQGPMLLGAGRYRGLGLMLPVGAKRSGQAFAEPVRAVPS